MPTFTALDFETGTQCRNSICQIGMVRVQSGQITKTLTQLVRPPDNRIWRSFTDIHGISWQDTLEAPTFAELWPRLCPWIAGQTVVAHNMAFDGACLEAVLQFYGLPMPDYTPVCTYQIYRQNLADLCENYHIPLNHHDALSDASACAQLFLRHLRKDSHDA